MEISSTEQYILVFFKKDLLNFRFSNVINETNLSDIIRLHDNCGCYWQLTCDTSCGTKSSHENPKKCLHSKLGHI